MTNQCSRCGTPRPGDSPICQGCGLDFRTVGAPPASPVPPAAAYQQAPFAPQPQAYPQPAPQPQGVPAVCPRCQAPLYPGYPICGNCGLDLRAGFGYGQAAAPTRSMLPIALAAGLVVALLAAAGAFFVIAQPHNGSSSSPSVAGSAIPTSPGDSFAVTTPDVGATSTPDEGTTTEPPVFSTPTPPAGPTLEPGGGVASNGDWVGLDTTTGIFTVTFTVSGNNMTALTVGYMGPSDDINMWTDTSTVDISSGSFDCSEFMVMTGSSGDTVRVTGTFTSTTAVSGTYEMHISGATVSGTWSGLTSS